MLEIVTLYVETFMVKKVKYLIFFIWLSSHMYPPVMADELKNLYPVKLDIFDGSGSLLLKWSSPDNVHIKEIKIFRRTNLKGEFKLISNIFAKNDNNAKYLDRDCKDGTRYFYYVEVIDKSNCKIKS